MNPTLDSMLRFHQEALTYRAARQEVISSNIANADTPEYRARDLRFADSLRTAQRDRVVPAAMARTATLHLAGAVRADESRIVYRAALQPSADGNTVSLDVERAQFAQNALHYEANLQFINGQLKSLLTAIQG